MGLFDVSVNILKLIIFLLQHIPMCFIRLIPKQFVNRTLQTPSKNDQRLTETSPYHITIQVWLTFNKSMLFDRTSIGHLLTNQN